MRGIAFWGLLHAVETTIFLRCTLPQDSRCVLLYLGQLRNGLLRGLPGWMSCVRVRYYTNPLLINRFVPLHVDYLCFPVGVSEGETQKERTPCLESLSRCTNARVLGRPVTQVTRERSLSFCYTLKRNVCCSPLELRGRNAGQLCKYEERASVAFAG